MFKYSVIVSDSYGCSDSDSITVTIKEVRTDGVLETMVNSESTRLYPNPASDKATLEFKLESEKINIQVLSIDNKVIYAETMNDVSEGSVLSFDVSQIPSEIYYVILQTTDNQIVEKLVIE